MIKSQNSSEFPSKIDAYLGIPLSRITPDTVISRDIYGNALSIMTDDTWHLPQVKHHIRALDSISFSRFEMFNFKDEQSLYQVKLILIATIFRPSRRTGTFPSHANVLQIASALHKLYTHAQQHSLTLSELLNKPYIFEKHIEGYNSLISLRNTLSLINKITSESAFVISNKIKPTILKYIRATPEVSEQHPVIPGEILFKKISNYRKILEEFDFYFSRIEYLNDKVAENPNFGRPRRASPEPICEKQTFESAMNICGLGELVERSKISQLSSVGRYINRCYYAAKMLIHIYTAMRETEAYLLKENCLSRESELTYIVDGLTIKLTSEPRPAKWITSKDILLPYNSAMKIKGLIAKYFPKHLPPSDHLFISASYLPVFNKHEKSKHSKKITQPNLSPGKLEKDFPACIITEDIFNELLMIDPLRDWQSQSEFQPGKNWNLTTHQFRRSIAVYAAQSGLVSLPSLKQMLHHTLLQMSMYYTKGFSTAKYLFNTENPDIVDYFKAQTASAESCLFLKDVVFNPDKLHGAAGIWHERNSREKFKANIKENYKDTVQKIKQGLFSYRETILGGCMKTGECHDRAHHNFIACFDCSGACIQEKKLDRAIESQQKILELLPPGTFSFNTEAVKLEIIQTFRSKSAMAIS